MKSIQVFLLILILFCLLNNVSAQGDDYFNFINQTMGLNPAKIYNEEITLKLTREGTLYQTKIYALVFNKTGVVKLNLPNASFIDLEVHDLKTGNSLVRVNDLLNPLCTDCYMVNSKSVFAVVNSVYNEVALEIDLLLYNDAKTRRVSSDYAISIPNISTCNKPEMTDDFKIKFALMLDKDIVLDKQSTFVTCGLGLSSQNSFNAFYCEGHPNVTKGLEFSNIHIEGRDKEKVEREIQTRQAIRIGVITVILVQVFSNSLSKIGDWIINCFKILGVFFFESLKKLMGS